MTHVRFITIIFIIFSIFTQRERNTHTQYIYGKLRQVIWWIQCARHDEPNSPTIIKSSIRMMNYYFKSQTELLIQPHVCAHCGTTNHYFFFYIHLFLSSQMNRFRSCFFVILMVYFSTVILLFVISLIVLINTSDSEVRTAASLSSSWISSIHLKKKLLI